MDIADLQRFRTGAWIVDPRHNSLTGHGKTIKIEKRLIRVLITLAEHAPQGVSKEQLLEAVWTGKVVSDDTLSVAISQLRKLLGCDAKMPVYIETITGFGFRLLTPVEMLPDEPPASVIAQFFLLMVANAQYLPVVGFRHRNPASAAKTVNT